jgi:hypothetical protein
MGVRSTLKVTEFGDWKKAKRVINEFADKRGILRDATKGVRDFANRFKRTLAYGIITNGTYVGQNWPAPSPKYASWKRSQGADPGEMLRLTYNYLNAIENLRVTQKSYVITMAFTKGDLNRVSKKRGLPMRIYMDILETGLQGRNIAARPLWYPAFRKIGGYSGVVNTINYSVGKRLRKHGLTIQRVW